MDIVVRISGAQGEGIETAGRLLATVAAKLGYHVFAYRQYGSIIKGNPTMFYQIRVSDEKIYSHGPWRSYDVLVPLNDKALEAHRGGAKFVLSEREIPFTEIALKHGDRIMRNIAAMGALAQILGIDPKYVAEMIMREFGGKNPKVVDLNIAVMEEAYRQASAKFSPLYEMKPAGEARPLLSGAEALALGAVMSGMKFYAAYPMTPASPIMHWLAEHGPEYGVAVVQAEDEIAAMNMVVGAAFAGVRAATGTSGGGFDLMHEAFGLAAMLETPAVVFLSQRGGPSTGLPTETEQSDLLMALSPSHGEYPHAVIAPRWIEEGLYAVAKAFNIAEKYQTPVIVLTDLYFNESLATVEFDPGRFKIERGELLQAPVVWESYKRYKVTDSGVSPRAIPGTPGGMHVATSDEHDERGDIITDVHLPEIRKAMHQKRMKKLVKIAEEMEPPDAYGSGGKTVVAWGSTSMPLLDYARGRDVRLYLFRDLYPLPRGSWAEEINRRGEVIAVEVNYRGQFAEYLAAHGVKITRKVLKWWGEPFSVDELAEEL